MGAHAGCTHGTATSVFVASLKAVSSEAAAPNVSANPAMQGPPASGEWAGRDRVCMLVCVHVSWGTPAPPAQGTDPHTRPRCAPGFFGNPLVLGSSCQPCDCSGNGDPNLLFSDCDPLTGACRGCLRHTTGPRCETCAPGFYGNALLPGNCTRRPAGRVGAWRRGWAGCPLGAGCVPCWAQQEESGPARPPGFMVRPVHLQAKGHFGTGL